MKRITSVLLSALLLAGVASGCSSNKEKLVLDKKHKPLPDYVLNSTEKVQETYIMASKYPQVLASVPCYCGCYKEQGHESNLDCYVDKLGPGNAVEEWDSMSIS